MPLDFFEYMLLRRHALLDTQNQCQVGLNYLKKKQPVRESRQTHFFNILLSVLAEQCYLVFYLLIHTVRDNEEFSEHII